MQALRLKTQAQFQALLACKPLARTEHFVMHRMDLTMSNESAGPLVAPDQPFARGGLWVGAMVPKRWARRAVTRNLIKRQIYSIAEQQLDSSGNAAYLVRLRTAYDRVQFRSAASDALRITVRHEIEQLFARIIQSQKAIA
jgi:ribonuclease P protein component